MTDFEASRVLVEHWGRLALAGSSVREALRIAGGASLWDAEASYLTLYRVPALRASSQPRFGAGNWRAWRGRAARLRDGLSDRMRGRVAPRASSRPAIWVNGFPEHFVRDVLEPVTRRLGERGYDPIVVTDRDVSGNLSAVDVRQEAFAARDAFAAARDRLAAISRPALNRATRVQVAALARTAPDLVHEWRWLFWREFPRLLPYAVGAAALLRTMPPMLLLSADDADQRARVLALVARAAGVPTLLVQQGLSRPDFPEFALRCHEAIAAMGPASRDDMVRQGVPPADVTVTGHPGFDRLLDQTGRDVTRAEFGVGPAERLIVLASQPRVPGAFERPLAREAAMRALMTAVGSHRGVHLLVKPHPGDDPRELADLAGATPRVHVVDRRRSIEPLIAASDLLATFFSTTALQALFAGRPVLTLDLGSERGAEPFVESRATSVARTDEDVVQAVRDLAGGTPVPRARTAAAGVFVERLAHRADGRAAERVADLAETLMRNRRVSCA